MLRFLSFNLRTSSMNAVDGAFCWPNRRHALQSVVRKLNPAIVGFQEARQDMIEYLATCMPDFQWFGKSRTVGEDDEHCPIFYRHDLVRLTDSGTMWLSETPEIENTRSWESACPRIATYGTFEDLESDYRLKFSVVNTHLDHVSLLARDKGSVVVRALASGLNAMGPVVLMGDFNSTKATKCYQILTKSIGTGNEFRDAWVDAKDRDNGGGAWTTIHKFKGLDFDANAGDGSVQFAKENRHLLQGSHQHIDWMMYMGSGGTNNSSIQPISVSIVTSKGEQEPGSKTLILPSDHFGLVGDFKITL